MIPPRSLGGRGGADLSTRARRIGLSEDEQRLLDRACNADADLRISHEVGCDFDQIAHVRAGDEELVARVVDRALSSSRRGRRSRGLAWTLGTAAALVSSVAAAAWWRGGAIHRPLAVEVAQTVQGSDNAFNAVVAQPAQLPAQGAEQAPSLPADPAASGSPSVPGMAHAIAPEVVVRSSARAAARSERASNSAEGDAVMQADGDTASVWFRRANTARHAGALSTATSLYGKLQERFPDSEEARLSHVSLGKLLLESGRALEAERQFSSYLAGSDRELAEEAWVGRAESLARLGRNGDERRSWRRLLQEFPASVYAARAKQRVDELDALRP